MDAIRRYIGDIGQVASARAIRLTDGSEDGLRAIDVRVQGGIHALVLVDRGLDIGPAWFAGQPLAWQSPTGIVHPAYFRDDVWLRSFHGGLLTTCGLQNVGPDNLDDGVPYGLHGRISNTPARMVSHRVDLEPLAVVISGEVRETDVYGADLLLRRSLRFPAGAGVVELDDEVINQGFAPAALMLLYHITVGYPVVGEGARLIAPRGSVTPRDTASEERLPEHHRFTPPIEGFPATVYEHRLQDPAEPVVTIGISNPAFQATGGLWFAVSYRPEQLPRLFRWRMLAPGMYLTGLEPANCGMRGRAVERKFGQLDVLAPSESRRFQIRLDAGIGPEAMVPSTVEPAGAG